MATTSESARVDRSAPILHAINDQASGLRGVIAIDSTNLGPAMGGCRFWTYETDGLLAEDATRLAKGMSYKNALADLPLGGGKSVLQVPSQPFDRAALFRAFGAAIESLQGQYITAEDVGTTVADMQNIREQTRYVAGLTAQPGRAGGDPSPWTALGVFVSLQVAAEAILGRELKGLTVAIQGVGAVGGRLARLLAASGAKVIVADISHARAEALAQEISGQAMTPSEIVAARTDIFAPCALGGAIDAAALANLRARVICGAANNQLAEGVTPAMIEASGIAYMPDYLVNAGGIINAAAEYLGESDAQVETRVRAIGRRLASVLDTAQQTGRLPHLVADDLAEAILHRETAIAP